LDVNLERVNVIFSAPLWGEVALALRAEVDEGLLPRSQSLWLPSPCPLPDGERSDAAIASLE
jgi:hypothetical protein